MDKSEVVARLKEHIRVNRDENNKLTWGTRGYCINYIMDFLFCDRKTAKKIFENEILMWE